MIVWILDCDLMLMLPMCDFSRVLCQVDNESLSTADCLAEKLDDPCSSNAQLLDTSCVSTTQHRDFDDPRPSTSQQVVDDCPSTAAPCTPTMLVRPTATFVGLRALALTRPTRSPASDSPFSRSRVPLQQSQFAAMRSTVVSLVELFEGRVQQPSMSDEHAKRLDVPVTGSVRERAAVFYER